VLHLPLKCADQGSSGGCWIVGHDPAVGGRGGCTITTLGGVAERAVKVMWDYEALPLWVDTGWIGQASSHAVPISKDLQDELQAWSDQISALMWGPKGPDAPGWDGPDRTDLERLNDDGLRLAVRVREALDNSWAVVFFDELATEEVEVKRPPTPRVRRHH
jgi:hypothetical protein